jgi:hypothetical protein
MFKPPVFHCTKLKASLGVDTDSRADDGPFENRPKTTRLIRAWIVSVVAAFPM